MKSLLSVLLLMFSIISFGQKKYSTNEIINSFPFSKTTKVKIISYNIDFVSEHPIPLPPVGKNGDSTIIKKIIENQKNLIRLPDIIGKEQIEGIKQTKTLNLKETIEISKILYNTCGKFSNGNREGVKCFFPRNAILFYDENDKVFEILEICFECHGVRFMSDKSMEINYMCDDFYQKIENYFKANGFSTQFSRENWGD